MSQQTDKLGSFLAQQAAKAVATMQTAVEASVKEFNKLATELPTLENNINTLKEEETSLEAKLAEKERTANLDLNLRLKENKNKTIIDALSELGKVAITKEELTEAAALKAEFTNKVKAEVAVATAVLNRQHEGAIALKDAEFKSSQAQNEARINSQDTVIENLKEQITTLKKQIDDDRAARVQEAQARGNVAINMPATNGR